MYEDRRRPPRRRNNQRYRYRRENVSITPFNAEECSGFKKKAPHYGDIPEEEVNAVLELEFMKSFLEKVERDPLNWDTDNGTKVQIPLLSSTKQWLADLWQRPCNYRRAHSAPPRPNRVELMISPRKERFIRKQEMFDSDYHSDQNSLCDDKDHLSHMTKQFSLKYGFEPITESSKDHHIVSSESEGSLWSDIDALEVLLGRC